MKAAGSMCRHCARPRCTHQFEWQLLFTYHQFEWQLLFTYDDLVRAVLAQQWAVAIAMLLSEDEVRANPRLYGDQTDNMSPRIAVLPCAVDVVNEMLGEA